MPKFNYIAMDAAGKETRGAVDAATQAQAIAQIRSQGLFPTAIGPDGAGGGRAKSPAKKAAKSSGGGSGLQKEIKRPAFLQPRVKPKDLMILTRQMATLTDAGLPLLRGLRVLTRQTRNSQLRNALVGMGESVESGSTFSGYW